VENCFHSIAINQECKLFTVEMSSLYLYTVHEESGIPSKKAKLDEVLAAHCRADLVTECVYEKEI